VALVGGVVYLDFDVDVEWCRLVPRHEPHNQAMKCELQRKCHLTRDNGKRTWWEAYRRAGASLKQEIYQTGP